MLVRMKRFFKSLLPVALLCFCVQLTAQEWPAKPVTLLVPFAAGGSGGVGSAGHLSMELLQSLTGIQLVHVPYRGSGPALADVLGGQIQAMLLTIPAAMSYIGNGSLRPLATSGKRRSPALPNLPTL